MNHFCDLLWDYDFFPQDAVQGYLRTLRYSVPYENCPGGKIRLEDLLWVWLAALGRFGLE